MSCQVSLHTCTQHTRLDCDGQTWPIYPAVGPHRRRQLEATSSASSQRSLSSSVQQQRKNTATTPQNRRFQSTSSGSGHSRTRREQLGSTDIADHIYQGFRPRATAVHISSPVTSDRCQRPHPFISTDIFGSIYKLLSHSWFNYSWIQ